MEDDSFSYVNVHFKRIINAPVIERSLDMCSDLTYACSNETVQHVEIHFPSDNFSYLASSDYDIGKTRRFYNMIENEGFWVGFAIRLPVRDIETIREYCERCEKDVKYDFTSLYCVLFPWLAMRCREHNTHSCASLTFNALLQSQYFRLALLEHVFSNNREALVIMSRSPNPMSIYRILAQLTRVKFEKPIVTFINEQYVYDQQWMATNSKAHIKTNEEFFTDLTAEGDQEASGGHVALTAAEKLCLSFLE